MTAGGYVACLACGELRHLVRPDQARGKCKKCQQKAATAAATNRDRPSAAERLLNNREVRGECWIWTGTFQKNGYGSIYYNGQTWRTHRLAYTLFVGPIPDELQIDHLCRVRGCFRPDHLEPVTAGENSRRARRAECVNGHEFTEDNVYLYQGKRLCRACRRIRNRYAARRRTAAARGLAA